MSEDEITLIRSDIRELSGTIDSLDRAVRGDEDEPGGLLADVRDHEARLTTHDRRAWAIRWFGSPLIAALASVCVWGGTQLWEGYVERNAEVRSNTVALAIIKERVDGISDELESNQIEILRAIRRREGGDER